MSSQGLEIMVNILRSIDKKQAEFEVLRENGRAGRQQDQVLRTALNTARDIVTLGIEDATKIEKAL